MEQQKKESESLHSIDEINGHLADMKKGQEELFEKLGISPHQYHHFLNDPERCSPVIKERAEKLVSRLEEMIDKKIEEKKSSKKRCCCCHEENFELN